MGHGNINIKQQAPEIKKYSKIKISMCGKYILYGGAKSFPVRVFAEPRGLKSINSSRLPHICPRLRSFSGKLRTIFSAFALLSFAGAHCSGCNRVGGRQQLYKILDVKVSA